ncbi:MAG: hypothetical protein LBC19_10675 [Tannerella sp.]|jgi:hypothetical protein|nr:hypothetical protein [Tannerella sp.]
MDVNLRKTGFKKVMIVMLVAFVGWISCPSDGIAGIKEKSNGCGEKNDLKNVTLKIAGISPDVRSEENSVAATETAAETAADLNGGWILFASVRNDVTKVMEITTMNTNILNGSQVDISLLTRIDGVEIRNVPKCSQYAYIIVNLPAVRGITVPAVNMSVTVLMQNLVTFSARNGIHNAVLFGEKTLMDENSKYIVRFDLAPVADHDMRENHGEGRSRKPFRYLPRCI